MWKMMAEVAEVADDPCRRLASLGTRTWARHHLVEAYQSKHALDLPDTDLLRWQGSSHTVVPHGQQQDTPVVLP